MKPLITFVTILLLSQFVLANGPDELISVKIIPKDPGPDIIHLSIAQGVTLEDQAALDFCLRDDQKNVTANFSVAIFKQKKGGYRSTLQLNYSMIGNLELSLVCIHGDKTYLVNITFVKNQENFFIPKLEWIDQSV